MGQQSILSWLAKRMSVYPSMVFRVSEIASGTGMSTGNCSRAIQSLVRSGFVEEVFLADERNCRYRISKESFEKVRGEPLRIAQEAIEDAT